MAVLNAGAVRQARYEGLGLTFLAGVVCGGLAVGLWFGERSDNLTPVSVASSTVQQPRVQPAAPVLAADREAPNVPAPDERRRRLLFFLMVNGAGSLGPYGRVGR